MDKELATENSVHSHRRRQGAGLLVGAVKSSAIVPTKFVIFSEGCFIMVADSLWWASKVLEEGVRIVITSGSIMSTSSWIWVEESGEIKKKRDQARCHRNSECF